MTPLFNNKPVTRLALIDGCEVAVTLNPDMSISFRKKGTRTTYSAHMSLCLELALCKQMEKDYNKRVEEYNHKKKLGYKRLKQPKAPKLSGAMLRKSVAIVLS